MSRKILLVRMDKIGDLVLTLNVQDHKALKGKDTHWWVSRGTEFVAANGDTPINFHSWPKRFSWSGFYQSVRYLKNQKFSDAIVFHAPWWVGFSIWLAGIPNRAGRLSQWHSFLFFNKGLRQSRSQSQKHESSYNWDLVSHALGDDQSKPGYWKMKAPEEQNMSESYFVVHPGMAGSALNWSVKRYVELIELLLKTSMVVVTGTPSDRKWTEPIKKRLGERQNILWRTGGLEPKDLLSLLAGSRGVIAPSTGVLHLAASLGVPAIGIYSPKKAESQTRWGPRGPKVATLSVHSGQDHLDVERLTDLSAISAKEVLEKLEDLSG